MIIIPEHTNCRNCGTCCGSTIPISQNEELIIADYVKSLSPETIRNLRLTQEIVEAQRKQANAKLRKHMTRCQFRDEVEKRCAIYPVRPMICRLFGIMDSLGRKEWSCNFGNSHSLIPPDWFIAEEKHLMPDFLGGMK